MKGQSVILIFLLIGIAVVNASVIGIDLGSESFKVALLKPKSFDLVFNEQGKRKTPTIVAFHDGEIIVGIDAKNMLHKKPLSTFANVMQLIGRSFNDPIVKKVQDPWIFPYRLVELKERGGLYGIPLDDNVTMTPQDLVGVILGYAKSIASKVSTSAVKDCVIAIPPFYNQRQRQAIHDAARLAGLNVLALINGNTAAAINWGIDREFNGENDTYAIFYDMGASSTSASLISFRSVPDESAKKNASNVNQATVIAYAWDQTLGGRDFDRKLAKHFQSMVNKAKGEDVATNRRVMAKLMAAAQKTKETLTANAKVPVSIDGLQEDYDFKTEVKREDFEKLCGELIDRAVEPVKELLAKTGLTPDKISYFEIIGGGTRVPAVQRKLQEYISRDLDKHVNADEGTVLGATFYAASQSSSFRTKKFKFKDILPFSVDVAIENEDKSLSKHVELFKKGSRIGLKKSFTFSSTEDFTISFEYANMSEVPLGTSQLLSAVQVSGIPTKEMYNYTGKPELQAYFRLSNSGMVVLDKVEAEITIIEYPKGSHFLSCVCADFFFE